MDGLLAPSTRHSFVTNEGGTSCHLYNCYKGQYCYDKVALAIAAVVVKLC
jgi:hypothetical protein